MPNINSPAIDPVACPFCGGNMAISRSRVTTSHPVRYPTTKETFGINVMSYALQGVCTKCGAATPACKDTLDILVQSKRMQRWMRMEEESAPEAHEWKEMVAKASMESDRLHLPEGTTVSTVIVNQASFINSSIHAKEGRSQKLIRERVAHMVTLLRFLWTEGCQSVGLEPLGVDNVSDGDHDSSSN